MRDVSIDLAKGIGIILVVIGHCINGEVEPGIFIGAFHMPLFFFLSGVCFNFDRHREFFPFLRSRLRTLLWPAVVFTALIYAVSHLLLPRTALDPQNFLWEGLPGAMWFLGVLFLAELLYWVIYRFAHGNRGCVIVSAVVCMLLALLTSHYGLCHPYSVFTTFAATAFYAAGNLLRPYALLPAERFGNLPLMVTSVICGIACVIITHFIVRPIGMSGNYVTLQSLPGAIFGIISVFVFCKMLTMSGFDRFGGGYENFVLVG